MSAYSTAIMPFFSCLGLSGDAGGMLMWPAVVLHLSLTTFLVRASLSGIDSKLRKGAGGVIRADRIGANGAEMARKVGLLLSKRR